VAGYKSLRWQPTFIERLPRRDRRGCDYDAYIPDRLTGRRYRLDGDVSADVADAESSIHVLNAEGSALTGLEGLARLLLRAEAVASSKIEGLEIGGRRLLHAEVANALGERPRDVTAQEVLGNVAAMAWAVSEVGSANAVTVDDIREIHRRLMTGTRLEPQGGMIRTDQNWVGGGDYSPCDAAFVPPPPQEVDGLLQDLCEFCNGDELPAVAQAAIAHAQFETIHPFGDGNGRTGRALIYVVLRRRRIIPHVLPPISLVLATLAREYVNRLMGTRYVGTPGSDAADEGLNRWIAFFASASKRAVADARSFEQRVRELQAEWRQRVGHVRKRSSVDLLIDALPGAPVITVNTAANLTGRTFKAVNLAVSELVAANVLQQIAVGKRNRAFEARELVDAFNSLERQLASPDADTRVSPPVRAVPARRNQ
jgi:Fic family protein